MLAASLLSVSLLLTACGGGDSSDDAGASGASSEGFPVTVNSEYGEVTVEKQPERIVALGVEYLDMLASIGEKPVAFSATGESDKAAVDTSYPWAADLYTDEYDPSLITSEYKVNVEAVAATDPDLILGTPSYIGQQQYDQLSAIAPTYVSVFAADRDWQDDLTDIGALTGKSDEAAQAISDVKAEYAAAAEKLPGLQGKTVNSAYYLPATGEFKLAGSFSWVDFLGLKPAANQPPPGSPATSLSAENIDQFAGDVVFIQTDEDGRAKLEADPRFAELPASKNGTVLFLDSAQYSAGTSIGPASLKWLLPEILPQLEASTLNTSGQ